MTEGFLSRKPAFFQKLKTKDKIVLLCSIALLAILLISISDSFAGLTKAETSTKGMTTQEYREDLETRLSEFLSQIKGVGKVSVFITLEGELSKDIAFNETSSQSSSSDSSQRISEQTTTTREVVYEKDGSGSSPFILTDKYPQAVGALIAAQGADDPAIREQITQAVIAALDVPAHKVNVLTRN